MSISDQLARFMRNGHGWVASGDLQRMNWRDKKGNLATPSNISRRLRELAADGILEVQIRRGHAHYRLAQKILTLFQVELRPAQWQRSNSLYHTNREPVFQRDRALSNRLDIAHRIS